MPFFLKQKSTRSVFYQGTKLTFSKLWCYYALGLSLGFIPGSQIQYFTSVSLLRHFSPILRLLKWKNSKIVCDRATSAGRSFWLNKCPRRPADVKLSLSRCHVLLFFFSLSKFSFWPFFRLFSLLSEPLNSERPDIARWEVVCVATPRQNDEEEESSSRWVRPRSTNQRAPFWMQTVCEGLIGFPFCSLLQRKMKKKWFQSKDYNPNSIIIISLI